MAELIPIEYRLRIEQRQQVSRWFSIGVISALAAVTVLTYTFIWYHQRTAEGDKLSAQYKEKSALIARSQELRSKRDDLAHRMQKIQELMDDRVLLSLLKNISEGFSGKDCLEYINIDARVQDPAQGDKPAPRRAMSSTSRASPKIPVHSPNS